MLHSKLWEWHDRSLCVDARMLLALGCWRFAELCSFRHLRCCVCVSFLLLFFVFHFLFTFLL